MNDTERALFCDEIARHKETQRELAKAQNALTVRIKGECCCPGGECIHFPVGPWVARALLAERQLAQAREAYVVRKHKDGFWLILHNEKGDAAINLFYERRGSIVKAVLEAAARDVGTRPVDLQASLEP